MFLRIFHQLVNLCYAVQQSVPAETGHRRSRQHLRHLLPHFGENIAVVSYHTCHLALLLLVDLGEHDNQRHPMLTQEVDKL